MINRLTRINKSKYYKTFFSEHKTNSKQTCEPVRSKLNQININDLFHDVICNIAIYADDTTLYSKSDQASDMWQELQLASELESDL